jgi:hypothetical protein
VKRLGNVPNYKRFLQIPMNKAGLAEVFCTYIAEKGPTLLCGEQSITFAGGLLDGKKVLAIQNRGVSEDPELA